MHDMHGVPLKEVALSLGISLAEAERLLKMRAAAYAPPTRRRTECVAFKPYTISFASRRR
jgi:hypothetical protein